MHASANTFLMANDREIELKLAIRPADTAAFRRLPLLRDNAVDGPKRQKVFNVYFDTAGLALKQHAMALRLRKTRWQSQSALTPRRSQARRW